ncbi:MAG: hypothetical protein ABL998_08615 [Planctomycetota bacterium]
MTGPRTTLDEAELVRCILARMTTDLALLLERDFELSAPVLESATRRPAGKDRVHISFKLAIEAGAEDEQGCLLVPLPEALALAGYLMMKEDEEVRSERTRQDLDGPTKEALLEIAKVLASACHSVLGRVVPGSTRSAGCQGVRANVRPALAYREGDRLLVARVQARLAEFEPFELILVLPDPARILENVSAD